MSPKPFLIEEQGEVIELLLQFICKFQSSNTQQAYLADVKGFLLFCQNQLDLKIQNPNQITEKLLLLWQEHLQEYSPKTKARKISSMSSFLFYLTRKRIIPENPANFIRRPPQNAQKGNQTNVLTEKEVSLILNCAKQNAQFYKGKSGPRFFVWFQRYVILGTLFSVGMRVQELCSLKIENLEEVEPKVHRLRMVTKGQEDHAPLIHEETALLLKEYISSFRADAPASAPIFISKRQTPIHRATVFRFIQECAKEAGLSKRISPHSARRTLGTLLHQNQVPIAEIQKLFNHKKITTTSLYIDSSLEEEEATAQVVSFFDKGSS